MASPTFLCSICQDHYALEHMRSIPCGHAHCANCTVLYIAATASHRGQYPCPQCRSKFKAAQLHPIFLEIAESASQRPAASGSGEPVCHPGGFHQQIAKALRRVNEVEEDQRSQTVEQAVKEIEDVRELMDERDCMLELVTAVAARWRGMLPLFTTLSNKRAELSKLEDRLREVKREKAVAEKVAREAIETSERTMPTLRRTQEELEQVNLELDALRRDTGRKSEEHNAEMERQREEASRLHTQLRALKAQEIKQKQEIKKLREKNKQTSRLLQSAAESQTRMIYESQDDLDVLPPPEANSLGLELIPADEENSRHPTSDNNTSRKRRRPEAEDSIPDFASETIIHSPPRRPASRREPLTVNGPHFASEWNLPKKEVPSKQRKTSGSAPQSVSSPTIPFPIKVDKQGRPKGTVQNGSRQKRKF